LSKTPPIDAHGDDPLGLGHLVVDPPEGGRHFSRKAAGDDHQVGLAGAAAEDFGPEARDVVAGTAHRHHLDRAAGQAKGHRPDGRTAGPLHHFFHGRREDRDLEVGF
jgi:hypothetical protein